MSIISNATSDTDNTNFELDGGTLNEIDLTISAYRKTSMSVSDQQLTETMGATMLQLNNVHQAGARLATDIWTDIASAIVPATFTNTPFKVAVNDVLTASDVGSLLAYAWGLKFPSTGLSLTLTPAIFENLLASLT